MEEQNPKSIEDTKPKKKKKKTAIMYGGKFYVPVDREKYNVKNSLNIGYYSTQCYEYLVTRYYFLSEKVVSMMLDNHIFVMMPSWSPCVDRITQDLNKSLFDKIFQNISKYKESKYLRDIRFPKYAAIFNFMESMMKNMVDCIQSTITPSYENEIFNSIRFIKNSLELLSIESNKQKFLRNANIYIGSCAEFALFNPQDNYPAVAFTIKPVTGYRNDGQMYCKYGILFKMKEIREDKTIFIEENEFLNYSNWKEFIGALELGRVGKILGETVYIPPYAKVGFMLDPTVVSDMLHFICDE